MLSTEGVAGRSLGTENFAKSGRGVLRGLGENMALMYLQ
jgi:hypothetical protein